MISKEFLESLIDLTEEQGIDLCRENGYDFRTVSKDGVSYIITMDLRFDRVNFEIEDGLDGDLKDRWFKKSTEV